MFKALNAVKTIDLNYKTLSSSPESKQILLLLTKLSQEPEIKSVLVRFLQDLNHIGFNQTDSRFDNRIKYYLRMWKFHQLHSVFWDSCHTLDISAHSHKLKWDYNNIGLLDPKNFTVSDYKQLILATANKENGSDKAPQNIT